MTKRQTLLLGRLHPLVDPALEFLYGVAPDGKFDEMKWHAFEVNDQQRLLKAASNHSLAAGAEAVDELDAAAGVS
jgi:hypothetical protein